MENSAGEESDDDTLLHRPVFIPKSKRGQTQPVPEDHELSTTADQKADHRAVSFDLLARQVKSDLVKPQFDDAELLQVDDTDDVDCEGEYAEWKLRELERVRRDKEQRELFLQELDDLERRREMTDQERRRDDLEAGVDRFKKKESQMAFMQKFFHKGAFFQDDEVLQERDFTAPTLEDKFDKKALPAVKQVKNFGLAGRTKWTHLANEDTTTKDSAWSQRNEVTERAVKRMGGLHDNSLERPAAKKKR